DIEQNTSHAWLKINPPKNNVDNDPCAASSQRCDQTAGARANDEDGDVRVELFSRSVADAGR
ncbi:MAG: hypothetical protein AAF441_28250, partial [Pseudomonadota bacterium]